MKNTRIYVAAMAVAMLFVTSCKKEESSVKQEFSATMEVSKSGEKTNLVNNQLQWAHGSDKVSITSISGNSYITSTFTATTHSAYPNNLSYANLDLDQDQTELAEGEGVTYRSIYPASISSENNTQVTLPRVQESNHGELTGYPMYAESSNKSLQFWNLCSVLKLSLTGTERISKIEVVTDKYINGTFTINYQNDNQPLSPTTATNHTKITTLTMSSPVTLSPTPSYFYIYLPVQQYKYIKINFYNEDNLVYTKAASISSGVTLERSRYHLIAFSTPEFEPSVLCGEFTVAPASGNTPARKVSFSKGNLLIANHSYTEERSGSGWGSYVTASSTVDVFKFADQQYNRNEGTDYTTWLFEWGRTSSDRNLYKRWDTTYSNTTSSWGRQRTDSYSGTLPEGEGINWRCLTQPEWDYLLKYQNNSSRMSYYDKDGNLQDNTNNKCFTLATVNGVHGLLIFPDVFYWPLDEKEITFSASNWGGNDNVLTLNQWKILESAGCVFLPATGYKTSSDDHTGTDDQNAYGRYWGRNKRLDAPRYLSFAEETSAFGDDNGGNELTQYFAIRLVKNNN